jgi:hypothetical protein
MNKNKNSSYPVARATRSNQLDWSTAHHLRDFHNFWSDAPAPATSFWALHDGTRLFLRYEVEDEEIVIGRVGTLTEQILDSDRVEIFFAVNPEITPYYALEIDPLGRCYAYKATPYRQFDATWEAPALDITTEETKGGYRVEISIQLDDLRALGCLRDNHILAGVHRAEFSLEPDGSLRREWITWINPMTPMPDFHSAASFGTLVLE